MKQTQNIFDGFHDIITPDPVSMFPASDGYPAALVLLAAAIFPIGLHLYKRHMRNLYRRDALGELERIRSMASLDGQLLSTMQLLKKAAIIAYGREDVAALSGRQWWSFLESKSGIGPGRDIQNYCDSIYLGGEQLSSKRNVAVMHYVTKWIRKHRSGKID